MRRHLGLHLFCLLTLWCGSALAQPHGDDVPPPDVVGDPHGQSTTWMRPVPAIQLEEDPRLRPAAGGGIMVPCMTDPQREPRYFVYDDLGLVAEQHTGSVTHVPEGEYTVRVGSGVPEQQLEFEVTVVEGRITFIPVEWSGLLITVVDERGNPFRGTYEIVRLPSKDYIGLGFGAAISEGEELETWLLWPGNYMLLAAGESYQARKNFATLRLEPGELVQYTMVLDRDTGDLMGAGEVTLAPEIKDGWDINVVLGGSILFNSAAHVVGKAEGQSLDILAFIETVGLLLTESHLLYGRLNLEAGGRFKLPDRPFVTDVDDLHLDLLYAYRVTPWFGPYVRTSAETNMFPTYQEFDTATDVVRRDVDGNMLEFEFDKLEISLAEPFAPLELEAGTGGRLDFSAGFWLKMNARLGVGFRQVFNRNTTVLKDDPATVDLLDLTQVEDVTQFGAEGALIFELTPFRWLSIKTDAGILAPFDAFDKPFLDFRGTVTLRLGSVASLIYTLRVIDDPAIASETVASETQIEQSLLLRFAYQLL